MAARKVQKSTISADILAKVHKWVSEYEGVSIQEVAEEFSLSDVDANTALVELSNADKVDVSNGMWVSIVEPAPVSAKRTRRTATQIKADQEEERKRTEYAARQAETQDDVMAQSPEVQKGTVKPAVEPVKASDGTVVTIPVAEGSTERRELDASQGERLISENWIPGFEESKITEEFEPPTILPAIPEGVNENTWFMAHCANTVTARAWWLAKAQGQMNAAPVAA